MIFCAVFGGSSLLSHPAYPVFLLVTSSQGPQKSAHHIAVSHSCLIDPNSFVLWKTFGSGVQFSVPPSTSSPHTLPFETWVPRPLGPSSWKVQKKNWFSTPKCGLGFRVQGLGFRVRGFRVSGFQGVQKKKKTKGAQHVFDFGLFC